MYTPKAYAVRDAALIEDMLEGLTFGCLVSAGPDGISATHMPFLYDAERRILAGHMARANPHHGQAGGGASLAIFQGVNGYISPSWYASKAVDGRVVPTWDYEAVHVHGPLAWRDDEAWLRSHLTQMTDRFEAGRAEPWAFTDAPEDYVQGLFGHLIGFELGIESVEAKRKLSQNRPDADQLGVIAGLSASASPFDQALAAAIKAEKAR
jgi:transcriptional regulator